MGVGTSILPSRNLYAPYPANSRPDLELREPLPAPRHDTERVAQPLYLTVTDREGEEEKAGLGIVHHEARQRLVDNGLILQRPTPLAHRAKTDMAEVRRL